jgi:hypothetical protein
MLHLQELNIRTLEHDRRVNDVNRHGWLRPDSSRDGRRLSSVFNAVSAIFAGHTPAHEDSWLRIRLDTLASGNDISRVA